MAERTLFNVLGSVEQRLVRQRCLRCRYARNAYVFHAGEAGDCLHLIERGRVGVQVGGSLGDPLLLTVLGEGAAFGEGALLADDHRRTASIVALEPTETLRLRADAYAELCREHPQVNLLLNAVLAAQVRRLSTRVVELAEVPGSVRLYRRLLELGDVYGVTGSDRPIPLTQAQLAALAMIRLRLANKVVAEAKYQRIVEVHRGRVVVLDWSRVAELAGRRITI